MRSLLSYSPRWTTVGNLAKSRLAYAAALIPIAGYAIIWSDALPPFLAFNRLEVHGFLEPLARLRLVYFGGLSILIGWAIFRIFAPRQVREFATLGAYIANVKQTVDGHEIDLAGAYVRRTFTTEDVPTTSAGWKGMPLHKDLRARADMLDRVHAWDMVRVEEFSGYSAALLSAFYEHLDLKRQAAAGCALIFLVAGSLLSAIPAVEVCVMVFRDLFAFSRAAV